MKEPIYNVFGESCKGEKILAISIFYNAASSKNFALMKRSIEQLSKIEEPCIEIAIVDNGSIDDTYTSLSNFLESLDIRGKRIHLIKAPKNLGFARANNLAYYALKDKIDGLKYIALVNNDLVPYPWSFKYMVKVAESDERIGCVQGLILRPNKRDVDMSSHYWSYTIWPSRAIDSSKYLIPRLMKFVQLVSFGTGAFVLLKKSIIDKIGLFEPVTFMFGDDTVLGAKLWKNGYLSVYIPIPIGEHIHGGTMGGKPIFTWWDEYYVNCLGMSENKDLTLLYKVSTLIMAAKEYLVHLLLKAKGDPKADHFKAKALARTSAVIECPKELSFETEWPRLIAKELLDLYPLSLLKGIMDHERLTVDALKELTDVVHKALRVDKRARV